MLNLSLIKIKNDQLKYHQKIIYKKIYEQICQTININADLGKNFCLFLVPEFILDEISYPFIDCLEYLNNKIEKIKKDKNIIEVSFFIPNVYYFKWRI